MPHQPEFRRRIVVLTVLAVIAMLAGAWLLVSQWQARAPVEPRALDAMNRQTERNTELMHGSLADRLTERTASEQRDRLESPIGLAMFRKCVEWTDFHENHPSEHARGNEERACLEYRQYIETGALPEQ